MPKWDGLSSCLFLDLAFSVAFRTKSELLDEVDKHDFVNPEAIIRSMVVSSMWTSLPRAMMSPCIDLFLLRCGGLMRMIDVGKH